MLALSKVAAGPFVSTVGTLGGAIADGIHRHAAVSDAGTSPLSGRTGKHGWRAGVAIVLVRVVPAVVAPVADVRLEDAARVVALEEARLTVHLARQQTNNDA